MMMYIRMDDSHLTLLLMLGRTRSAFGYGSSRRIGPPQCDGAEITLLAGYAAGEPMPPDNGTALTLHQSAGWGLRAIPQQPLTHTTAAPDHHILHSCTPLVEWAIPRRLIPQQWEGGERRATISSRTLLRQPTKIRSRLVHPPCAQCAA